MKTLLTLFFGKSLGFGFDLKKNVIENISQWSVG